MTPTRWTSRRAVVAGLVAGALLGLLALSRPWVTADLEGGWGTVTATGRQVVPAIAGLALVVLAAAVAAAVAGRRVRAFALGTCVLAGAGIAWSAVRVLLDPAGSVTEQVRERTGVTTAGRSPAAVDLGVWPWAAVAAGLLIVAVAVLGLLAHRHWSGPARRYERGDRPAGGAGREAATLDPVDTWQALSRGDDPT